jgi:hypothetical protein
VILLTLPIVLAVWAYSATGDLRTALDGAVRVEGVVERIDVRRKKGRYARSVVTGYVLHVRFTTPDGEEITRAAQAEGAGDGDTTFGPDSIDPTDFRPEGTVKVDVLYHPELDGKIWIDDFWLLWIFPLFMAGAALLSLAIAGVVVFSAVRRPVE